MEQGSFFQVFLISTMAVASVLLLNRIRFPAVTGLLLAGSVMGPFGLGLLRDLETLRGFSEAGLVMLLFTIGLEVDPTRLKALVRPLAIGGGGQWVIGTGAMSLLALALGLTPVQGFLMGSAITLSSSAVVLPLLARKGSLETPAGQQTLGILLFQDLAFIPLMLLVSALGGSGGALSWAQGLWLIAGTAIVLAGGTFLSRWGLPYLLEWVDATRSREAFLLAVLAICLGFTWVTSSFGLSSALGAFLAGVVLAGTDYAHRALGDVLPLRGLVTSLFFVSLGTLFDPAMLVREPFWTLGFLLFLVVGKSLLCIPAVRWAGASPRVALETSLHLGQFSEFGFVLVGACLATGLIPERQGQALLAAGSLSLFLSPLVLERVESLAQHPWLRLLRTGGGEEGTVDAGAGERSGVRHVLVIGYGASGRFLARALARESVPYQVLELNARTVRLARKAGEPVIYADATRPEALLAAEVGRARAVVILINDDRALRRIVPLVRGLAPEALVLVRTRYLADRSALEALGAHRVITEELEGGLAMLGEVLRVIGLSETEAGVHLDHCRQAALEDPWLRTPLEPHRKPAEGRARS